MGERLVAWYGYTKCASRTRLVDNYFRIALAQEHADLSLSVGTFNKSKTGASPINFSKKISLYQQNMSCPQSGKRPAFTGKFSVSVEPSINGNVSYGVAAVGSIIPPRLDEFGFFVGLDATVASTLAVDASLTVSTQHKSALNWYVDHGVVPPLGIPVFRFNPPCLRRASRAQLSRVSHGLTKYVLYEKVC